jgi:hypothetical protein
VRLLLALMLLGAAAGAAGAGADDLRAKHAALKSELAQNAFGRPLHLDSKEGADSVAGDIHAVVGFPFGAVATALARPESWCDILLLVFNIKQCRNEGSGLDVRIGRKHDQPLEQAYRVAFDFQVAAREPGYLAVNLAAPEGPVGTRDYRIRLEALPLGNEGTFLRFAYSYGFGFAGRLAMKAYLGTAGADKVGFTQVGQSGDGAPRLVGGMRGVVERNAMRYYLAIESHLGALSAPPAQRFERAMRAWFTATERYKRQLHEIDEAEYLAMKRKEYSRQAQAATRTGS